MDQVSSAEFPTDIAPELGEIVAFGKKHFRVTGRRTRTEKTMSIQLVKARAFHATPTPISVRHVESMKFPAYIESVKLPINIAPELNETVAFRGQCYRVKKRTEEGENMSIRLCQAHACSATPTLNKRPPFESASAAAQDSGLSPKTSRHRPPISELTELPLEDQYKIVYEFIKYETNVPNSLSFGAWANRYNLTAELEENLKERCKKVIRTDLRDNLSHRIRKDAERKLLADKECRVMMPTQARGETSVQPAQGQYHADEGSEGISSVASYLAPKPLLPKEVRTAGENAKFYGEDEEATGTPLYDSTARKKHLTPVVPLAAPTASASLYEQLGNHIIEGAELLNLECLYHQYVTKNRLPNAEFFSHVREFMEVHELVIDKQADGKYIYVKKETQNPAQSEERLSPQPVQLSILKQEARSRKVKLLSYLLKGQDLGDAAFAERLQVNKRTVGRYRHDLKKEAGVNTCLTHFPDDALVKLAVLYPEATTVTAKSDKSKELESLLRARITDGATAVNYEQLCQTYKEDGLTPHDVKQHLDSVMTALGLTTEFVDGRCQYVKIKSAQDPTQDKGELSALLAQTLAPETWVEKEGESSSFVETYVEIPHHEGELSALLAQALVPETGVVQERESSSFFEASGTIPHHEGELSVPLAQAPVPDLHFNRPPYDSLKITQDRGLRLQEQEKAEGTFESLRREKIQSPVQNVEETTAPSAQAPIPVEEVVEVVVKSESPNPAQNKVKPHRWNIGNWRLRATRRQQEAEKILNNFPTLFNEGMEMVNYDKLHRDCETRGLGISRDKILFHVKNILKARGLVTRFVEKEGKLMYVKKESQPPVQNSVAPPSAQSVQVITTPAEISWSDGLPDVSNVSVPEPLVVTVDP